MSAIGSKEFNSLLDAYALGQEWLNGITVEIEGGENELDPLTLLRAQEQKPSIDTMYPIAAQFIMNKRTVFRNNGKEVLAFVYTGGELSNKFKTAPYLLDVLLKMAWGLMLKKLTPPSFDSENEERSSTETTSEA